jgi:hypothetical protein
MNRVCRLGYECNSEDTISSNSGTTPGTLYLINAIDLSAIAWRHASLARIVVPRVAPRRAAGQSAQEAFSPMKRSSQTAPACDASFPPPSL